MGKTVSAHIPNARPATLPTLARVGVAAEDKFEDLEVTVNGIGYKSSKVGWGENLQRGRIQRVLSGVTERSGRRTLLVAWRWVFHLQQDKISIFFAGV